MDPVMHSRVNTCTGIESSYQVLHGPCLHLIMGSVAASKIFHLLSPFLCLFPYSLRCRLRYLLTHISVFFASFLKCSTSYLIDIAAVNMSSRFPFSRM